MFANVLRIVFFVIALAAAGQVYADADKLKRQGAKVSPLLWALLTFFFLVLALPLYLVLRLTLWQKQTQLAQGLSPRPMGMGRLIVVFLLTAFLLLGALLLLAILASLWMQ
jgi:hypothetical protein